MMLHLSISKQTYQVRVFSQQSKAIDYFKQLRNISTLGSSVMMISGSCSDCLHEGVPLFFLSVREFPRFFLWIDIVAVSWEIFVVEDSNLEVTSLSSIWTQVICECVWHSCIECFDDSSALTSVSSCSTVLDFNVPFISGAYNFCHLNFVRLKKLIIII